MNKLTVYNHDNLPTTLEDLSNFVLVGREKLTSVRAEIRAIDKLNLAQEVRDQKKEECLMLSEALLDSEVRLGDLLKQIPKAQAGRPQKEITDTIVANIQKQKPKKEVIQELGFSQKQAERFETLANNKDIVEAVKAEARENDDIPTRTRVLELAKARKQEELKEQQSKEDIEYYKHLDFCADVMKGFLDALYGVMMLNINQKYLEALLESFDHTITINEKLKDIELAISILGAIKNYLKSNKGFRVIKGGV